jgi:WD40 repeat protein
MVGEIKLWDVISQVCIHACGRQHWIIRTLFFSPGNNVQCYVLAAGGPMIRIARNKRMEFAATILKPSLGTFPLVAFSLCGTFFAAISYMASGRKCELSLFDLRTIAKTQSVFASGTIFAGIAMSPDGKKLATVISGGTRIFERHDLTIQKHVENLEEPRPYEAAVLLPITFDPTSRFFAVGCFGGRVELRTL